MDVVHGICSHFQSQTALLERAWTQWLQWRMDTRMDDLVVYFCLGLDLVGFSNLYRLHRHTASYLSPCVF
ncbi:MAG: hypothetical protein BYD32DRAFT_410889 [Podila humilis]|nr:MAG: hypothetical protein BYD32DRAFT_410889 [Podila humilis]